MSNDYFDEFKKKFFVMKKPEGGEQADFNKLKTFAAYETENDGTTKEKYEEFM